MPRLALYQPDIPQNTGAAMRLAACLGTGLDVIEPCGFPWDERRMRRSGMDYMEAAGLIRHASWQAFRDAYKGRRIILLTTKAALPYTDFSFKDSDILLAGRESAGVPEEVHDAADGRVVIPLVPGMRSLNVVTAAAMVLGEALRQTKPS
jgi:tRNA (cytidine/uridine-2'-O-)-methyltransferase